MALNIRRAFNKHHCNAIKIPLIFFIWKVGCLVCLSVYCLVLVVCWLFCWVYFGMKALLHCTEISAWWCLNSPFCFTRPTVIGNICKKGPGANCLGTILSVKDNPP